MRSFRLAALSIGALLLAGATAAAQTEPDAGRPGRGQRGQGFRGMQRDPVEVLQQLRTAVDKELQLTPQQKPAINQLFEAQGKELQQLRVEADKNRAAHEKEIRELEEQLRSSEGDREKTREARRRLDELNAPSPAIRDSNQKFYAAVKEQLTEQQRPTFDQLVARASAPPGSAFIAIRRALNDLDLTEQQKARVDDIQQKHREVMRQARAEGSDAVEALVKQLRQEILAELTDEQKTQFAAAEEKYKNEPMGPGGPGGRRRRGGDDK
ncbi:MAG TPA: hypothetical protein VGM03_00110 [Phycisphaerae bacterium]|jgi:Spy/CpxP family protein refolding chaperone